MSASFLNYHGYPAHICLSPNETIVHGIPDERRLRGGRHPLGGLGAPSSRAGTAMPPSPSPSGRSSATQRLLEATENGAVGRHRAAPPWAPRLGDVGHAIGPSPKPPGLGWCRSTPVTASAARCTRSPRCSTTATRHRAEVAQGDGDVHRTDVQPGERCHPGARRRLDGGDRRRFALGPLRAHRGHHPRWAPGAHRVDIRYQAPDSRYQIPGTRFQIPGTRFQVPDSRFQVPGTRFQVPGTRFQDPDSDRSLRRDSVWHLVSGIWHLASGVRRPLPSPRLRLASGIWHLASGVGRRASGDRSLRREAVGHRASGIGRRASGVRTSRHDAGLSRGPRAWGRSRPVVD